MEISGTTFCTDSKVVLGYIQNESRRFYVYVVNRVQLIRKVSSPERERESSDEFKQLCDRLLLCTTVAGYQAAKSDMDLFIKANDSRAFLTSWVLWWHERRGFILFRIMLRPGGADCIPSWLVTRSHGSKIFVMQITSYKRRHVVL